MFACYAAGEVLTSFLWREELSEACVVAKKAK